MFNPDLALVRRTESGRLINALLAASIASASGMSSILYAFAISCDFAMLAKARAPASSVPGVMLLL
jgi:hypothetical protein